MTQEEKAKAYDKALERAKGILNVNPSHTSLGNIMENIFPELRESDDERIRKEIKHHISLLESYRFMDASKEECLAYLEKQKESLHIPDSCKENADSLTDDEEMIEGIELTLHCYKQWIAGSDLMLQSQKDGAIELIEEQEAWLAKQKEQKPNYCHHEVDETGWTEEYRKAYYDGWNNCNMQHSQLKALQEPADNAACSDCMNDGWDNEYMLNTILSNYHLHAEVLKKQGDTEGYKLGKSMENWLRKVVKPLIRKGQKPAEWSEEDEKMMNGIRLVLESWDRAHSSIAGLPSLIPSYIDWLKSLRPQPKQEWSEEDDEHIDAICRALTDNISNIGFYTTDALCSWLKSLPHRFSLSSWGEEIRDGFFGKFNHNSWKPSEEQMKALPKWKKADRDWDAGTIDFAVFHKNDGGDHEDWLSVEVTNRLYKGEYYIELSDLDILPKEE